MNRDFDAEVEKILRAHDQPISETQRAICSAFLDGIALWCAKRATHRLAGDLSSGRVSHERVGDLVERTQSTISRILKSGNISYAMLLKVVCLIDLEYRADVFFSPLGDERGTAARNTQLSPSEQRKLEGLVHAMKYVRRNVLRSKFSPEESIGTDELVKLIPQLLTGNLPAKPSIAAIWKEWGTAFQLVAWAYSLYMSKEIKVLDLSLDELEDFLPYHEDEFPDTR